MAIALIKQLTKVPLTHHQTLSTLNAILALFFEHLNFRSQYL